MAAVCILLMLLPLGSAVKQSLDQLVPEGYSITLTCSQISTSYNSMFWFKQQHGQGHGPEQALELIVNSYVSMLTVEDARHSAQRDGATLHLTLAMLKRSDSGVSYCVKQEAQCCVSVFYLNKNK
ncbi:hypothetical protein DPEC_G00312840 [Dallia pectoralis]|uniref:Uncharacterized protein n=1 Tax=Dallia pectoralis TaxID=75939 RepID=A0ACC2FBV8_DALPE|nr:hypothetical protein DPEC_G00312840 [Dallia pectoralis]